MHLMGRSLTKLDFSRNIPLTDAGLSELGSKRCPLRDLTLSCVQVTDVAIRSLAQGSPTLMSLCLRDVDLIGRNVLD